MTRPIYKMGSGVAYVYERVEDPRDGEPPIKPINGGGKFFYEELAIGSEDYTVAKGEHVELSMRIRILRGSQKHTVNSRHIIRIDHIYYEVWRVRGTVNARGVPVLDITMNASTEVVECHG